MFVFHLCCCVTWEVVHAKTGTYNLYAVNTPPIVFALAAKTAVPNRPNRSSFFLDPCLQAGAQRMRTQKFIVKYAMCVANLDFNKSLDALHSTVDNFDEAHQGLIFGSDNLFLLPAVNPDVREHAYLSSVHSSLLLFTAYCMWCVLGLGSTMHHWRAHMSSNLFCVMVKCTEKPSIIS